MAKTTFLTFYIVLTDAARVAELQAQYPQGVNRAPWNLAINGGAAVEFAAPWRGYVESALGEAPYTWTPWSGYGETDGPYPIDVATFTRKTGGFWGIGGTTTKYYWIGQFVYAPSTAEPPGGTGEGTAPDLEYAPIALRRWITGFEVPQGGPAALTGVVSAYSFTPDAARHTGGLGLALRGPNNNVSTIPPNKYRAITPYNGWLRMYVRLRRLPTGNSVNFWSTQGDPTSSNAIALDINASGQITVYNGFTGGRSVLGTIDPPLPVWSGLSTDDAWRRLDLLYEYANGAANGYFRLFVDGALAGSFAIAAGNGLGTGVAISSIRIGDGYSGGANTLELDIDDAFDADLPAGQDSNGTNGSGRPYTYSNSATYQVGDLVHTKDGHVYKAIAITTGLEPTPGRGGTAWHRYEGRDWLNGTRILLSKPKAFGTNHSVNWTGNIRIPMQNHFQATSAIVAGLTSSTSLAVAEVDMDVAEMVDTEANAAGVVSVLPTVNSTRGANSGQLGYNINGAGNVDAAITEGAAGAGTWNSVLYPGPVGTSLIDVSPLLVRLIKGSGADAAAIRSLVAEVEVAGVFDRHDFRPNPDGGAWDTTTAYQTADVVERKHVWYAATAAAGIGVEPGSPAGATIWDAVELPEFPRFVGQHNWPYRRSPYVLGALAGPNAPVIFVGGTYTGNATGQDLTFRAPVGLLFIRPTTGGAGGYIWWPTMETGHPAMQQGVAPLLVEAGEDLSFTPGTGEDVQSQRYWVRIAGSHAQINANAVVYQYIAVLDPGARFMLNAAASHNGSLAADADNVLIDDAFLADWVFAFVESFDTTATNRFYAKGPGSPAQTITNFATGALASALSIATGKLTSKSAWHAVGSTGLFAFNLWRKADGNNDPGQASVVNINTYIGDGSASRTINLSPASGKRPLFALVFSDTSGVGYWRDPSHTSSNSANQVGTDTATGITSGGIDAISVGSSLNANGVIYNYIVFFAGTTACNNGWGCNGEYFPVEAAPPATGPWPPEPVEPVEPVPPTPTPPPEEPELAAGCVAASQKIVNRALAAIGVSKQITDLANELTQEAVTARLHIKDDVETVLRRHPWAFATAYATITVAVGGTTDTPVNADWQYSYRAPTDMIRARRLVNQTGTKRKFDPEPPAFRLGRDATGTLLFSDLEASTTTPVVLEYTRRPTCPAGEGDALFRLALMWKHAESLAPALSKDPNKALYCKQQYELAITKAQVEDSNEQERQTPDDGDPDWLRGR